MTLSRNLAFAYVAAMFETIVTALLAFLLVFLEYGRLRVKPAFDGKGALRVDCGYIGALLHTCEMYKQALE